MLLDDLVRSQNEWARQLKGNRDADPEQQAGEQGDRDAEVGNDVVPLLRAT